MASSALRFIMIFHPTLVANTRANGLSTAQAKPGVSLLTVPSYKWISRVKSRNFVSSGRADGTLLSFGGHERPWYRNLRFFVFVALTVYNDAHLQA
jgi:hypothetical protein